MKSGVMFTTPFSVLVVALTLSIVIGHSSDNFTGDSKETESFLNVDAEYVYGRARPVLCGRTPGAGKLRSRLIDDDNSYVHLDNDTYVDKILGGYFVARGDIPWQANILIAVPKTFPAIYMQRCGGSIISQFWILSAAHCFLGKPANIFKVRVGDHHVERSDAGEQTFSVETVIVHELYRTGRYDNNIALVKIQPRRDGRGISFNYFVQPICLANANEIPREGTPLIFSGFGRTAVKNRVRSVILKRTILPTISKANCNTVYIGIDWTNMICAGYVRGNTDLCSGDDGGPAAYKIHGVYIVFGIFAFGTNCSPPNYPVGFTSVSAYRSWIDINIARNSRTFIKEGDIPRRPYGK